MGVPRQAALSAASGIVAALLWLFPVASFSGLLDSLGQEPSAALGVIPPFVSFVLGAVAVAAGYKHLRGAASREDAGGKKLAILGLALGSAALALLPIGLFIGLSGLSRLGAIR